MSDLDKLLEGYKDDGVEDSTGAFTIDFQKAREKLARFQLADPHELILKLIQAGNLASSRIAVTCGGKKLAVSYDDWNRELTLQKLADRLASASLTVGDDPLTHLCVGLSAMMAFDTWGIRLRQTFQGETAIRVLRVGKALEWEELESGGASASDTLEVFMEMPAQLSAGHLFALLEERCGYAPVPIIWQGKPLVPKLPVPPGAHRPKFFEHNKVLAEQCLGDQDWNTPLLQVHGSIKPSERMAHLMLTVDLDPKATIWFCKAGVLAEKRRVNLGVPGVIGVVAADDVPTDLTGSQFQDSDALTDLEIWLRQSGQALLGQAITATQGVISEGQPGSASAPVKTLHGCSGVVVAMIGWVLGMMAIDHYPGLDGWGLTNFFFWLFFPIPWVSIAIKRHGCDKDDTSDAAAKAHLLQTLLAAKRS